MSGPQVVRDAMADFLRTDLAQRVPTLRRRLDVGDDLLPAVDIVVSGTKVDQVLDTRGKTWVEVVNPRLFRRTMVGLENGFPTYVARYSCRLFLYVKGVAWESTERARDMLVGTIRAALDDYPTLSHVEGDSGMVLVTSTMTEDFGDPVRISTRNGGSPVVWAPAVLAYQIDHEYGAGELSLRDPFGIAETVTLDAGAVGPTEALPEPTPTEDDDGDTSNDNGAGAEAGPAGAEAGPGDGAGGGAG